jgi:hypothetical protein
VVHQETASISVAPACLVQVPPAALLGAAVGAVVAEVEVHAEATMAATEITARSRDGSFTDNTSLA